ncbi:unnamed protein product [Cylindrotheca closterium]|uniref:Pre-mRNA-processing factor 19 n=1 Tax=Cylindrotheca closterium TaxID=2856 RepID=A0AAD2CJE8_9STRA|nr:unnamed protein product [Cylindrotheca closterium]
MSLICEISGESLASTTEEIVVTPSGHTCIKRLLLAKLSENGGVDPFEQVQERPLSEDQLVTLSKKASIPPPRVHPTSLPNLLQQMQKEYDALVLELFDTRKALEDTRQELSQALYQNDAAVRVVARLSMERDAARQELEKWNSIVTTGPAAAAAEQTESAEEPSKKRRRTETPSEPLQNDIPSDDLQEMVDTWGTLQPQRKPMLKKAAAAAPTAEDLVGYVAGDKKALHKTTCKGLTAMAKAGNVLVTAGKDKQVIAYSLSENVVLQSFNFGSIPTCVDIFQSSLVAAANKNGRMIVYSLPDGSIVGELQSKTPIVNLCIHPSANHLCIATKAGKIIIYALQDQKIFPVSEFSGDEAAEYTCGALHPDGLIYAAGTTTGKIHMWDFKNKLLASVLEEGEDSVEAIEFSNNGYHVATSHSSATVRVWDLRKQKTIATLNPDKSLLEAVSTLAFDESGKYLAYGGKGGVQITAVKEWGETAKLASKSPVSAIAWGEAMIATTAEGDRVVSIHQKS